ncbi:pro-sigmaK processing inhibitor BofA family protein [Ectobacillus sp. sgz5001026]|uniref:pro-sigmaK processing inhibitor BofA family protein n=1 Tax=Ectobacillus sp. sgz5001026 TaxID=3242473 RepID=UPI0036D31DA7
MDHILIISVIVGCILLLLVMGASLKPIRFIGSLFVKVAVGALFLFGLNVIGAQVNFHIPINFMTACISGLLGIPGVAALVIIKLFVLPH